MLTITGPDAALQHGRKTQVKWACVEADKKREPWLKTTCPFGNWSSPVRAGTHSCKKGISQFMWLCLQDFPLGCISKTAAMEKRHQEILLGANLSSLSSTRLKVFFMHREEPTKFFCPTSSPMQGLPTASKSISLRLRLPCTCFLDLQWVPTFLQSD